ncbi:MAG: DUF4190 domain-containing protein [Actinomycetota bacterium]|nr:DUF4190 domain-containing protein [Actinomycetota bacterium]
MDFGRYGVAVTQIPPPGPDPSEPTESSWPAAPPGAGSVNTVAQGATSGNAIAALVLSIASWVVCPIVFAIIALIFASLGRKEIEASGGARHGMELVTAARIVAWINIGLWAALLVIGLIVGVILLLAGGIASVTPSSVGG